MCTHVATNLAPADAYVNRARQIFSAVLVLTGTLIGLLSTAAASAEALFPIVPMPRVEAGGHSGDLKRLAVSPTGDVVLTVSDDKTARLWRADSGRLIRILRLPIDSGDEGQIFAGTFSPDGRWIVLGGFTRNSPHVDGHHCIYVFDAHSSAENALYRLEGFASAARDIAFSPDSRYLAISRYEGSDLRIFDWAGMLAGTAGPELRHPIDAGDENLGIDFSRSGDLVATTRSGWLHIYTRSTGYREKRSTRITSLPLPIDPRYSPDGSRIAFGSELAPQFAIVDARTLKIVREGRTPTAMRGLYAIEWSSNGEQLYAGGETTLGGPGVLYRFTLNSPNTATEVLRSERLIRDLQRLTGNRLAFATAEPEVGIMEEGGRMRWRKRSSVISVRDPADLLASPDGRQIQVRAATQSNTWLEFKLDAAADKALQTGDTAQAGLLPARRTAINWSIAVSSDNESLTLNGVATKLDPFERIRTYAFPARGDAVIVGTSWTLRKMDRSGKSLWALPLASEVDAVLVTRDGNRVIAALADGTVRWYRYADGQEVLSLLALRNGKDWVAWTPAGYYVSSPAGDTLFGWHLNRADAVVGNGLPFGEFFRASQFERVLYRPDIVAEYFRRDGRVDLAELASSSNAFRIEQLDSIAPPKLTLQANAGDNGSSITLTAQPRALRIEDWNLFVNGVPVLGRSDRQRYLDRKETTGFSATVPVSLTKRLNSIRVEASNGQALGVIEQFVDAPRDATAPRGDLYIVAIGAGQFTDPGIKRLRYAWRDATEFATLLRSVSRDNYKVVHAPLILADGMDSLPTGDAIKQKIAPFVQRARAEDTVVVFMASHGLSDSRGNYYFVPADGRLEDIERVRRGPANAPSLIPWQFFFNTLAGTAGKRVLIVDTCSSAAIQGTFDSFSLAKRSMSSSFAMLAASTGKEESQESDAQQHGLFTYGLMDAIRTGFDPNGDGSTSLAEAFEHAFDRVQDLHNRAVGPQTPQFSSPDALLDMPLARVPATKSASVSIDARRFQVSGAGASSNH